MGPMQRLVYIFEGKDELTPVGRKMAAAMKKHGEEAGHGFANKMKAGLNTIGPMAASAIGVGLVYAVKEGLKVPMSQLKVTLKDAGSSFDAMKPKIDATSDRMVNLGFGMDQTYQSVINLTRATGNANLALKMQGTVADLAKIKHLSLADASMVLARAADGQLRALKGLNVTMISGATHSKALEAASAALADQVVHAGGLAKFAAQHHMSMAKAQELATKAVHGNIGAYNTLGIAVLPKTATAAERLEQVQKILNSRIGGTAVAASKTFAGKLQVVKTQFSDIAAKIGLKVLPALSAFMSIIVKIVDNTPLLVTFAVAVGLIAAAWVAVKIASFAAAIGMKAAMISSGVGAAILAIVFLIMLIITHWKTVKKVAIIAWNAIKTAAGAVFRWLRGAFATVVNFIMGYFATILHGAAWAFGWIPGLGGKLKTARDKFDKFRDDVNKAIRGINDKTVHVKTKFGIFGPSGGKASQYWLAKRKGGEVTGPGTTSSDSIPALLSHKEYVVQASAHNRYGTAAMNAINSGRAIVGYASGGAVAKGVSVKPQIPDSKSISNAITMGVLRLANVFADSLMGSGSAIVNLARKYVGRVPYVWGGASTGGWDCSGMISWLYNQVGILHNGRMTAAGFQNWAKPSGPVPGGMVFFGRPAYHIGLSLGNNRMIAAASPALGTIYDTVSGNSGFGIPPRGFGAFNPGAGPLRSINVGREMAARYGWGSGVMWNDLYALWNRESGWNPWARNPSSGAAGIPQDITGNFHGGVFGQIAWGLRYIRNRYGNPMRAWEHEVMTGWYDHGGILKPGLTLAYNGTGRNEYVGSSAGTTVIVNARSILGTKREVAKYVSEALQEYKRNGGKVP